MGVSSSKENQATDMKTNKVENKSIISKDDLKLRDENLEIAKPINDIPALHRYAGILITH